jgi:hypothetical protein
VVESVVQNAPSSSLIVSPSGPEYDMYKLPPLD